ncbi:MAG TPA: endonuclease domain-containing protein, partial [Mycobacteriales bacterium]|nr:endonuclease domain-containing protein [Mycobacteriales bacterium]
GRVRGMLCYLCNQALGNTRDSIARLQGLIGYLRLADIAKTMHEFEHTCCVIELDSRRLHAA